MSQIQAVLPVLMIPKDMNIKIADNLHHYEFQCRCRHEDCTYTLVSQDVLSGWNAIRKAIGKPLKINSGYRCQKHNSDPNVKGVPTSRHKSGHAIDIYYGHLEKHEKEEIIRIAKLYFDVVIVYDTFTHLHMEPDNNDRIFVGHREQESS